MLFKASDTAWRAGELAERSIQHVLDMQLTNNSTDATPNPREPKVSTSGSGERRDDRSLLHWFDGLSEAFGVASILIYLILLTLLFSLLKELSEDVQFDDGLLNTSGMLSVASVLVSFGVLISIAVTTIAFRSYKRLRTWILVLQFSLFLVALIAFAIFA